MIFLPAPQSSHFLYLFLGQSSELRDFIFQFIIEFSVRRCCRYVDLWNT